MTDKLKTRGTKLQIAICLGLALVTIALFWPVHSHGFVNYDDPDFVTDNPHIRAGLTLENFKYAFSDRQVSFWRPLSQLALMLNRELFGLNAGAHHLVSLLFHVANTLVLFWVLKRMTGLRRAGVSAQTPASGGSGVVWSKASVTASATQAGALWRSAFVAALFAWHPLHVEPVVWATDFETLLSGLFWMLTFWAYAKYVSGVRTDLSRNAQRASFWPLVTGHWSLYYCLSLLFFALGLMSKATIVTLPFVLLLLDYWPLMRVTCGKWQVTRTEAAQAPFLSPVTRHLSLLLEKLPFFVLTAISTLLTIHGQQRSGIVSADNGLPLNRHPENVLVDYFRYIRRMVWPDDLAIFYPPVEVWPLGRVIGAGIFLMVVSVLVVWWARRRPFLLVGWLWFLGTLVPVIGLVQIGSQSVSDRYTYVPLIGLFIAIAWGAHALVWHRGRVHRAVLVVLAVLALGGYAIAARLQIGFWKSSETLFIHALAINQDNYVAHENLATALAEKRDLTAARQHLNEALLIKPDKDTAHFNLGLVSWLEGKPAEAIAENRKALLLRPTYVKALNNLAWLLATTPDATLRDGAEAVRLAERAAELTKPEDAETFDTLAAAYAEAGRFAEAVQAAQKALKLAEADQMDTRAKIQKRLAGYESGKPYRE